MSDEINAVLDRIEEAQRALLGSRPSTPLEFLQAVYSNEGLPISVRMRAAIEAAPFIHPQALRHGADWERRVRRRNGTSNETISESHRTAQGHRTSTRSFTKGLNVEAAGFACSVDLLARQPLSKARIMKFKEGCLLPMLLMVVVVGVCSALWEVFSVLMGH